MLYFSSAHVYNKIFRTLEDLFKDLDSRTVVLVLDTNIVIYLRDFFLNPKLFMGKHQNGAFNDIRYLLEQISRYDFAVNATLGVDESSRKKEDFSILNEKWLQTHTAVHHVLHLDMSEIESFINTKNPEEPIKSTGIYPDSMIPFLEKEFFYQHHLIVTYLLSLKIVHLNMKCEKGELTNKDAYLEFCEFMRKEVDFVFAIMQTFAWHVFGGVNSYGKIIFPDRKLPINDRLHQIFNGSIDLVFPGIANKVPELFYAPALKHILVPVFVSTDKRISELNSLISLRVIFDSNNPINYNPNMVQSFTRYKLNWTSEDYNEFDKISHNDIINRFSHFSNEPRKATHLLGLVERYESYIKTELH